MTAEAARSVVGAKPVGDDADIEIVAFCCHYCAYAAADLAGSLRLQYPSSVKVVKLPCTGKQALAFELLRRAVALKS